MEGQGRILNVVVGEELCGVACCMGSGIVVLEAFCHTIDARNLTAKTKICVSFFEHYIVLLTSLFVCV